MTSKAKRIASKAKHVKDAQKLVERAAVERLVSENARLRAEVEAAANTNAQMDERLNLWSRAVLYFCTEDGAAKRLDEALLSGSYTELGNTLRREFLPAHERQIERLTDYTGELIAEQERLKEQVSRLRLRLRKVRT